MGHLDECADCRTGWERYNRAVSLVRKTERVRAPPNLAGNILRRVRRSRWQGMRANHLAHLHYRVPIETFIPVLLGILIILLAAKFGGALMVRARQPAVLGELLVGVLLGNLVLFGFVYPSERDAVPAWVLEELTHRLRDETANEPPREPICQGTLLSRAQYLVDIDHWGYTDARIAHGHMAQHDINVWTDAIATEQPTPATRPMFRTE